VTTEDAIARLYDLKRGRTGKHERPHKPILLLAVLDLIERELITANRILPSKELRDRFSAYFKIVRQGNDQNSPENPFYYLCSEGFWSLHPKRPSGALSWAGLQREVSHASLRDDLYTLMCNPLQRELLREAIYSRYFADHRDALRSLCNTYTQKSSEQLVAEDPLPGRDAAFRKLVIDVYDYRCAACGLRLHIDTIVLVEAAHLIPWSESHDDNPRNGMALCRNHHYAMDRHLIAPTPDKVWKVSKRLDRRLEGQKDLIELNGEDIILPSLEQYHPRPEALEWRRERLLV
jgi:putative restriction endonuclease